MGTVTVLPGQRWDLCKQLVYSWRPKW